MLFGRRPFGDGKTQEQILSEGIIRNANIIEFPQNPKVSDEAKDFIRECLTRDQHRRYVCF